jgi:hypothetical protein
MSDSVMGTGLGHFFARRFDKAKAMLLRHLQQRPAWVPSLRVLAACYAHMGQMDKARHTIHRLVTMDTKLRAAARLTRTSMPSQSSRPAHPRRRATSKKHEPQAAISTSRTPPGTAAHHQSVFLRIIRFPGPLFRARTAPLDGAKGVNTSRRHRSPNASVVPQQLT